MGYAAKVIALDDVRASHQRQALRQQLHERFDHWLDALETQLPASKPTFAQVSETIWKLRQVLTAGVAQTIVEQTHQAERHRASRTCAQCDRLLKARAAVSRTAQPLIGAVEVRRPYFYCRSCHLGCYPLDEVLGLPAGRMQRDVHQAAVAVAIALPADTASTLFGRLSGLAVSRERLPTLTNRVAEGLRVWDVAPSRDEIDQRVAQVAQGRFRRPVLGLGIDGAYVPSRPEHARGRRPGQARSRAKRARWRHEWREAQGFRFYLLDGDRVVQVLSWHQIQNEQELGEALKQVKDAGLIPDETVRLCVVCDGVAWRWKHVQALFPSACQGLDYYHCAA